MKNITIILLLIPFWSNCVITAQIELSESYAFAPDKTKHLIVGSGTSIVVYSLVYHKTKNEGLAFRAGWMSSAFAGLGKEVIDMTQGKEMSLSDMSYTIAGGLASSSLMYGITKWRQKRQKKKLEQLKKRLELDGNWPLIEKNL